MNLIQLKEQLEEFYNIFPKDMMYYDKVFRIEKLAYQYIEDNFCHKSHYPNLYEARNTLNIFIDFIDEKRRIGKAEYELRMEKLKCQE